MANGISNVAFSQPSDPTLELADIARKRKLAEALQVQAMQPAGGTDTVGGWAIKKSPLEGLGKMAQALSANYQNQQLDEREKSVASTARTQDKAERERIIATLTQPAGMPVVADPNAPQPPTWLATAPSSTMNDGMPAGAPQAPTAPNARPLSTGQRLAMELARSDNPAYAQMGMTSLMAALQKDPTASAFSKIDPKDYTSASVAKFAQSSNYADLVPVRKKEIANLGGVSRMVDPYADITGDLTHTMKPDTAAQLAQSDKHWAGLSGYQSQELPIQRAQLGVAQGNLGVNRTNAYFNTGMGAPGGGGVPPAGAPAPGGQPPVVGAPAMPQGAQPPAMPQGAPQAVPPMQPGLTPKAQAEINADNAKQNNSNARDATSILNLSKGAEALLDKAHGSGVGNAVGGAQNFLGMDSEKNQADAQLTALSGALVSKQPKMSGPQSDKDVLLYKQMAGDIGNATLPAGVRKAALKKVREIAEIYKNGYSATGYQGSGGASGGWDGNNRRGGVTQYDASGNPVR